MTGIETKCLGKRKNLCTYRPPRWSTTTSSLFSYDSM